MLPTMQAIPTIQNQRTNRNASANTTPLSEQISPPVLVACFILPYEQAETIITILQGIAANSSNGSSLSVPPASTQEPNPAWLTHSEAARYLGVSISTLYRYAEQERTR